MRLNPTSILKEHESAVAPEAGVNPLPSAESPLDPVYKVWSAVGAWPVAFGLMSTSLGLGFGLSLFFENRGRVESHTQTSKA